MVAFISLQRMSEKFAEKRNLRCVEKTDRGVWNVENVECGKFLTLILYSDTKIHAIYLCHSALDSHPFFPDNLLGKWLSCEKSDFRKLHSVK